MFAAEIAMVTGKDDNGIIYLPILAQSIENTADVVIETLNHSVILGHQHTDGIRREPWCLRRPHRRLFASFVDRPRDGHLHALIHFVIRCAHSVGAVRIGIAHHITEGLALFLVHKVDDLVGEPVSSETLFICAFQAVVRSAILRGSYTRPIGPIREHLPVAAVKHEPVIFPTEFTLGAPLRLAITIQMPFASVTSGVTLAAQHLGKGNDVITQLDVVIGHRRVLRVFAAHERTARGRADRSGGIETGSDGSVFGNPIDIGGLDDFTAVTTERLEMMLISLDNQQVVRPLLIRRKGRKREAKNQYG